MKKNLPYGLFVFVFFELMLTVDGRAQTVFINEIHYDNSGTDVEEAIEIAGLAGTDLKGWKLEMYNGSNGTVYRTVAIDTVLINENSGYGTTLINLPVNGLQNGAPDGIALIDASNTLVQFLSYEGSFVATAGVAIGITSTDIGVAESSSTAVGSSLQLTGTGTTATDFTWQSFPTNTYDAINEGQTFEGGTPSIPAIIINEIDVDTPSTDTMEFVELYDGGKGNTSLNGLVTVLFNGNNNLSYNTIDLDGFSTNSEGYFVIGNEAVANVDLILNNNGLQNGADAIAIYAGNASDFPNGSAITTENLIDAIVYDTNDEDDAELLVLLNDGEAQLNEDANNDKNNESLHRIPNGAGGARNTDGYTTGTPTPGANNEGVIIPPPTGELISIVTARQAVEGTIVTITGTLTVSDQFAGSAYIQDTTGAIAIFDPMVHGENNFVIGDSITVTGSRSAFQDQLQLISLRSVVSHGQASLPIEPIDITLVELAQHPAELVRVVNTTFPRAGDLLFGNSNFRLTDASGTGDLRIDNDVEALVGLAQPELCDEVIGVVGRFRDFYQLLPRQASDLPCAVPFVAPIGDGDLSKDETFDVATWNIEWFGDESNSPPAGDPRSDAIQRDSVRNILLELDADVIAVEEIADDVLFAELVNSIPGYDYILSDAVSNPIGDGVKQKVGFIYKTAIVSPKTTRALLRSIHPLYNGGDDSALQGYPEGATDRFYASGRLPFLMTADVTINGKTEEIDLIALHARANNSSAPQQRYDFRKFDVEVLKDSLDVQFADRNFIVLGDYNDDVDQTVADVNTTVSSFQSYVDDPENYNIVTSTLSEAGFRSFVARENMIDHIMISDELNDNYVENSASVGYEFYDNDYSRTASDHLLVSARLVIGEKMQNASPIVSFTIVDARTNEDILTIVPDQEIPFNNLLGSDQLSIRANTMDGAIIGSLVLSLSGVVNATRTEGVAPYALFGDLSGNYFGKVLITGVYSITATPFALSRGKGEAGIPLTVNFSIGQSDRINSFTLVNADTNDDIMELTNGDVIDATSLTSSLLAIRANTNPRIVGSVVMALNGPIQASRIESVAPYAVFADLNGDYFGKILTPGIYTITAVPYSEAFAKGIKGETSIVTFTVLETLNFTIAPNPIIGDEIAVHFPELVIDGTITIPYQLHDQLGTVIAAGEVRIVKNQNSIHIGLNGKLLYAGVYYLSVVTPNGVVRLKVMR